MTDDSTIPAFPQLNDATWLENQIAIMGPNDIASLLGCHRMRVHDACKRFDIKIPTQAERAQRRAESMIGQRFGMLVVTSAVVTEIPGTTKHLYRVAADCDCGGSKVVSMLTLLEKRTGWDHCGCQTYVRGIATRRSNLPDGPRGKPIKDNRGYLRVRVGDSVKKVAVHRWVMEQVLGRQLLPHEQVHHRNGVRDDNRPENLELWSISQPSGQRVTDKVAWAHELLTLYGHDELRDLVGAWAPQV